MLFLVKKCWTPMPLNIRARCSFMKYLEIVYFIVLISIN